VSTRGSRGVAHAALADADRTLPAGRRRGTLDPKVRILAIRPPHRRGETLAGLGADLDPRRANGDLGLADPSHRDELIDAVRVREGMDFVLGELWRAEHASDTTQLSASDAARVASVSRGDDPPLGRRAAAELGTAIRETGGPDREPGAGRAFPEPQGISAHVTLHRRRCRCPSACLPCAPFVQVASARPIQSCRIASDALASILRNRLTVQNERRFLVDRAQAEAFVAAASPHLVREVYDPDRPLAYAKTLYYDTDDGRYFATASGPILRRLRLRQYAAARTGSDVPVVTGPAFLELKESRGASRAKVRLQAPVEVLGELIARRGEAPRDWRKRLQSLRDYEVLRTCLEERPVMPRISTWYRRMSFSSDDGRVRITIDEGVAFSAPTSPTGLGEPIEAGQAIEVMKERVLEVKHDGDAPAWLRECEGLYEPTGFSKFRRGMMLVVEPSVAHLTRLTAPLGLPALPIRRTGT